ncbi:hypothetical protein MKW98_006486, partial [Papaver atlanticum]
ENLRFTKGAKRRKLKAVKVSGLGQALELLKESIICHWLAMGLVWWQALMRIQVGSLAAKVFPSLYFFA